MCEGRVLDIGGGDVVARAD